MIAAASAPGPLEWLVLLPMAALVLIPPALCVFLLVYLFIKLGRRGRIILASVLLALFLMVLALAALAFLRMPRVPSGPVATVDVRPVPLLEVAPVARPVPPGVSGPPVAVQAARRRREVEAKRQEEVNNIKIEKSRPAERDRSSQPAGAAAADGRVLAAAGFEPDLYPSRASAIRAVSTLLARQYKAMITSEDEIPRALRVEHAEGLVGGGEGGAAPVRRLTEAAARAVVDVFGSDAPHLETALTKAATSRPADADAPWQIVLYLSVPREPQPADGSQETGIVEGRLAGRAGQCVRQVEYVNKPWREDFDRWRSSHEAVSWVLGESEDFCASRQGSVDQARRSAALHVRERVSRELQQSVRWPPDWLRRQADLYHWLDDEAYRRLQAGDLETDVFTQEFQRPYGSVWRSAVLVHIPPDKARSLVEAYRLQAEARRTSVLTTAMSGAGLLVLIVGVYVFLNAATRGYYVWSVRAATAVLAALGLWCLWTFVS